MVEKSLTYPLKGSGKFRHVLGATLIYFSWLFYPVILLVGYYIQTLTYASVGQEQPPPFGQILSLSKLGIGGIVVIFTYGGFFIAAPLLAISMVASEFITTQSMGELSLMLQLASGVLSVFALAMALILPIVLCRYGRTVDLRSVYDFTGHIELLKTREVLIAMVGTFLLTIGVVVGTTVFVFVTLGFGLLFVPFILFWYCLTTAHLYGTAIGKATGTVQTVKYQDIVDEISNTGHKPNQAVSEDSNR